MNAEVIFLVQNGKGDVIHAASTVDLAREYCQKHDNDYGAGPYNIQPIAVDKDLVFGFVPLMPPTGI